MTKNKDPDCGDSTTMAFSTSKDGQARKLSRHGNRYPSARGIRIYLKEPKVFDRGIYELEIKDEKTGSHFMLHFSGDSGRQSFIEGVRAWEDRSID